jgi:RimJ/RimL family protein N-acetyltransferase
MEHAWPLYDLKVSYDNVELSLATDDDLLELIEIAKRGIHPMGECPFSFPWSEVPSPQFERNFLQFHWRCRSEWKPDNWTLELAVRHRGTLVGSQGMIGRQFGIRRAISSGSWIGLESQGHGIGTQMRAAMLGLAFDHLDALTAQSGYLDFNEASKRVSEKLGYVPDGIEIHGIDSTTRDGAVRRIEHRMLLTREAWQTHRPEGIEVNGLERCKEMFVVDDPK